MKSILKLALVASSIFAFAYSAEARRGDRVLRMDCSAEMISSDRVKIRMYTYTSHDRDYDVFRCRLVGERAGEAAFDCGNEQVRMIYLNRSAPGRAWFHGSDATFTGFSNETLSCPFRGYVREEVIVEPTYNGKPEYQQQQQQYQQQQQQVQQKPEQMPQQQVQQKPEQMPQQQVQQKPEQAQVPQQQVQAKK